MTEAQHACVYCYKAKPGRFTRRKNAAGGGWSQGMTGLVWACYDCLPHGQGKGEEMPTVTPSKPAPVTLTRAKTEGLALLQPLNLAVLRLTIETPEDYAEADDLLGRVSTARKTWASKLAPILGPLKDAIASAKKAMEGTAVLNKEVDGPLEQLEGAVRLKMKAYKVEEARQLRAAEDERIAIEQAIADAAAREEAARTNAQRAKATEKREALEVHAEVVRREAPQKTYVGGSWTRTTRKPTVTDLLAFCRGVADGYIPTEAISVENPVLQRHYKDDPESVTAWPGVSIVDDVVIVRR